MGKFSLSSSAKQIMKTAPEVEKKKQIFIFAHNDYSHVIHLIHVANLFSRIIYWHSDRHSHRAMLSASSTNDTVAHANLRRSTYHVYLNGTYLFDIIFNMIRKTTSK